MRNEECKKLRLLKARDVQKRLKKLDNPEHAAISQRFYFVRRHEFSETLKISNMLLADRHDLIHKATGWILREIGKRDLKTEEKYLKALYKKMPRTMLRYAIEKFPEEKRQRYLKGSI
jgi:3-methyladenine DNA glycosylase AlkD